MYQLLKPFLFSLDPERAHYLTVDLFKTALATPLVSSGLKNMYVFEHPALEKKVAGLTFPNPVGLAAGFDKDGKFINQMRHLGFGFIELGTVTPLAQVGNDKPRLFRLPKDQALINRMGFNNEGVDALVSRLKDFDKGQLIIGGNIGKNKVTPNANAVNDYLICFDKLHPYVDYFVVNVSSPNTPGLRELQEKGPLLEILSTLQDANNSKSIQRPIFLKIAPDLTDGQLDDIISIVTESKTQGIIATNTTISRNGLQTSDDRIDQIGNGGLSGAPVKTRSTEVIQYLRDKAGKDLHIIGVGGITTPEDAIEKIKVGADLIQVYSGMVYSGPTLIKNIKKALVAASK